MKAKRHPEERPRGVRDPAKCMVQSGGRLVWIEDGQPMFWSDRPVKFPGHIRLRLRKRGGVVITDVKWRQLAGRAWWRLPDWPAGLAAADGLEEVVRGHTTGDKPVIIGPGREATERTVRDGYEGRSAEGAEVGRLALHRHRRRRGHGPGHDRGGRSRAPAPVR